MAGQLSQRHPPEEPLPGLKRPLCPRRPGCVVTATHAARSARPAGRPPRLPAAPPGQPPGPRAEPSALPWPRTDARHRDPEPSTPGPSPGWSQEPNAPLQEKGKQKACLLVHLNRGGASGAEQPRHPIRWEPGTPGRALSGPGGEGTASGEEPRGTSASARLLPPDFRLPSDPRPPSRYLRPAPMLPKRRRARGGTPDAVPSATRFPGFAIYLAEPRMGRSRRAFLTRLALSKGFRVLDAYRCAVAAASFPPEVLAARCDVPSTARPSSPLAALPRSVPRSGALSAPSQRGPSLGFPFGKGCCWQLGPRDTVCRRVRKQPGGGGQRDSRWPTALCLRSPCPLSAGTEKVT